VPYLERYERRVPLTEDEVAACGLGITIRRAYRPKPKTAAFVRRIRTIATELFAARALLAAIGETATWLPQHDEAALNAHASLLTAMALKGAGTAREANAPAART